MGMSVIKKSTSVYSEWLCYFGCWYSWRFEGELDGAFSRKRHSMAAASAVQRDQRQRLHSLRTADESVRERGEACFASVLLPGQGESSSETVTDWQVVVTLIVETPSEPSSRHASKICLYVQWPVWALQQSSSIVRLQWSDCCGVSLHFIKDHRRQSLPLPPHRCVAPFTGLHLM